VLQALAAEPAAALHEVAPADRAPLEAVHSPAYLDRLEALARTGGGALDADTVLGPASWPAVLGAAGAALAAVDEALAGGAAFAAIRPPGHHALADRAMGFCFVNNLVVAARHGQHRGAGRVLIVDWDVHHGNGTQALVERDPSIRFVSLHQWPWYPGTGAATERGVGNVFNVPRPPGLPPEQYVADLWDAVTAATADWCPDLILVSAGYDAMRGDPLGGFTLEPGHFACWVDRLRAGWPDTPIAAMLEGGYAPGRVAEGALATVRALGG
jgi:acetoin utilization deacetylase AcuC-like enzyme